MVEGEKAQRNEVADIQSTQMLETSEQTNSDII